MSVHQDLRMCAFTYRGNPLLVCTCDNVSKDKKCLSKACCTFRNGNWPQLFVLGHFKEKKVNFLYNIPYLRITGKLLCNTKSNQPYFATNVLLCYMRIIVRYIFILLKPNSKYENILWIFLPTIRLLEIVWIWSLNLGLEWHFNSHMQIIFPARKVLYDAT